MGDEQPFTTRRETSQRGSQSSTSQHQAAYAAQRAEVLFGCYRRGDANDPERYVAAIAAVLSVYETELIREVTDPRTGIMTTEKYMTFMPNSGELKVYCDGIAARRDRINRLGQWPAPDFSRARLAAPDPSPGDLATVHVPDGHVRYSKLVEWSKTADPRKFRFGKSSEGKPGIWVSYDEWLDGQRGGRLTDVPVRQASQAAE